MHEKKSLSTTLQSTVDVRVKSKESSMRRSRMRRQTGIKLCHLVRRVTEFLNLAMPKFMPKTNNDKVDNCNGIQKYFGGGENAKKIYNKE